MELNEYGHGIFCIGSLDDNGFGNGFGFVWTEDGMRDSMGCDGTPELEVEYDTE